MTTEPPTDQEVELVLRKHLPVRPEFGSQVFCLCDVTATFEGPVPHRLHVVAALREAGVLRG